MDNDWIAAGVGFLAGALLLGLFTTLAVLIDIRVSLTQTKKRSRRPRDIEEDL